MNFATFMGRLASEPEQTVTQSGVTVVRFRFAVNRKYKKEGQPEADFFSCTVFGRLADGFSKCQIHKGTKLLLTGEMQNNNYTDQNGVKHYTDVMIVEGFEFCESRAAQEQQAAPAPQVAASGYAAPRPAPAPTYATAPAYAPAPAPAQPQARQRTVADIMRETAPAADPRYDDSIDGFMNIPEGIDEELLFV